MKEESKYYTPEIEEFHVGFEYEFRTLKQWEKKVMTWNDYPSYGGDYIGEAIKEIDGIRVKHLDREDIESLGFELLKRTINGKAYKHKDNDELQLWWSSIGIIDIDNGMSYEDCRTYFSGTIKNKSELKRILKQLNI